MEIPEKLTFVDGYYFTDGGSIVLLADDPDGTRHQITLGQHRFLDMFDPNLLPGRLYFNSLLVPVRSEMEARVIGLLQDGEITPSEAKNPEGGEESSGTGPVVVVGDDLKEYYGRMSRGKGEVIPYLIGMLLDFVQSRDYVRIAGNTDKKVSGDH